MHPDQTAELEILERAHDLAFHGVNRALKMITEDAGLRHNYEAGRWEPAD